MKFFIHFCMGNWVLTALPVVFKSRLSLHHWDRTIALKFSQILSLVEGEKFTTQSSAPESISTVNENPSGPCSIVNSLRLVNQTRDTDKN